MKHSNNLSRVLCSLAIVAVAGVMAFAGCTKVDDTLGSNLIPENQEMKAGFATFSGKLADGSINPNKYFETRLYQTDSIIASNLGSGYFGTMLSDTFGLRTTGFLSQYVSYYSVDSGYFGYRPIFDSAQILLGINSYTGDTLQPQTYYVYEVLSNKYITDKPVAEGKSERDSNFYLNFDPVKEGIIAADSKPLFEFTFPDGTSTGPATTAVTMTPTDEGRAFVRRLMLQEGKYKDDYSIYSLDSLEQFIEEFKGLYIMPKEDATSGGAIYTTNLESTGLSIYGRNRLESDPTLIKDTIGLVFYFYDEYAEEGNLSVNTVKRDYSKATVGGDLAINLADAVETNESRPENRRIYVDGMGGVISELTFSETFFKELEAVREKENELAQREDPSLWYTNMGVSQAKMSIYFTDSDYDWQNIPNLSSLIDEMDRSMERVGAYTSYKKLNGISDYAYLYEQQYSTTLAYGGYINRSRGCYVLDISAHLQEMWNSYMKEKKRLGLERLSYDELTAEENWSRIEWDNVEKRSFFIGPEAYSLFTPTHTVIQGGNDGQNSAPIQLDLTYTMLK